MSVPCLLHEAGVASACRWQVYRPAVVGSLLVMGGLLFRLERQRCLRAVYRGTIGLVALVQLGCVATVESAPSAWALGLLLGPCFVGFNTQAACPAWSRGWRCRPSAVRRWVFATR